MTFFYERSMGMQHKNHKSYLHFIFKLDVSLFEETFKVTDLGKVFNM